MEASETNNGGHHLGTQGRGRWTRMESYSTETLFDARRVVAWNNIYSTRLAMTDFIPQRGDFTAGLQLGHLGGVGLARLVTGGCTIRRAARHIDHQSPELYSFIIQAKGKGQFAQGRNETVLRAGDFTLCASAAPHYCAVDDGAEILLIRVPVGIIRDYLPHPELLCGRRLPAREGLTPAASAMAYSVWSHVERGFSSLCYEETVAHQLLELIAISYSMVFGRMLDGPSRDSALFSEVRDFIEDHLRDGELSAAFIADALDISPADMRDMFARRNDTLRGFILRRRLEEIARRIRDPKWRGATVSEIAFGWGFNSAAHFTRSFRARYGISPVQYRNEAVN